MSLKEMNRNRERRSRALTYGNVTNPIIFSNLAFIISRKNIHSINQVFL